MTPGADQIADHVLAHRAARPVQVPAVSDAGLSPENALHC